MAVAAAAVGTVDFWCCPRVCAAGQVVVWACRLNLPGHWPLSRSASEIASSFRLPPLPHHTTSYLHFTSPSSSPPNTTLPWITESPTDDLQRPTAAFSTLYSDLSQFAAPLATFFSTLQTPPRLVSPCSAFPALSRFHIALRPPTPSPHSAFPRPSFAPQSSQNQTSQRRTEELLVHDDQLSDRDRDSTSAGG
jgi:hypothetical protein